MSNKFCPKCNTRYSETANYCRACGLELVKDKNACSENKGAQCHALEFNDDDIFCECCGALTTFAKARKAQEKAVPIVSIPLLRS